MKLGRLLLAILLPLCFGLVHAAGIDHLIKQQTAISAQVEKVKASEKEESLFLEDVLRRKNSVLREQIGAEISAKSDPEKLKLLVTEQATLLQALIDFSEIKSAQLFEDSRKAEAADKAELQFLAQQRLSTVDVYYNEFSTTLDWAKSWRLRLMKLNLNKT